MNLHRQRFVFTDFWEFLEMASRAVRPWFALSNVHLNLMQILFNATNVNCIAAYIDIIEKCRKD